MRRNKSGTFLSTFILVVIIVAVGFVYFSPQFEKNIPKISFKSNKYWNLHDKLKIVINDESSIRYYKVTFIDGKNTIILDEKLFSNNTNTRQEILVKAPKLDMFYKGTDVKIKVEVVDNSKWNFLNGNSSSKTFDIKVDRTKPIASVINNSRYIKRGGSAVVIVKVKDDNIANAYIEFNKKIKFKLTPFYKENYFIALIAWDINIEEYERVNLIAIDKAENKTVSKVPLYIQSRNIKKDTINISEKFINNVSKNVLSQSSFEIPSNPKDIFIKQNNSLRAKNVSFLRKLALLKMDYSKIDSLNIDSFQRMRGSKTVAGFAEKRTYVFDEEKIDEAWHLGMDWAKVKNTKIVSSNPGKVIFSDYLGIYGNTVIIDHGLGLSSLYAHANNIDVSLAEEVSKNTKIGNTGISGAVLGDHLHFGILIQGIEVDPIEWMDKGWIKVKINDIIEQSKKYIDQK